MKTPDSTTGIQKTKLTKTASCVILGCITILAIAIGEPETGATADSQNENRTAIEKTDGKLVLRRKFVTDSANGNMKSHSIFVPDGWKMEGKVQWPHPNFFQMLPSPKITVSSPDGHQATINPTCLFSDPRPSAEYRNTYGMRRPRQHTRDGGNMVLYRPDSLRKWSSHFQDYVIPLRHPKATNIRINKVTEIEQFTKQLRSKSKSLIEQVQKKNQQARFYGMRELQTLKIQGLMIEAEFVEQGAKKEFVALVGLHSIETQIQGMTHVRWSVEPNLSFVAPNGELESRLPILFAITGSMRPTMDFVREVQRYVSRNTPPNMPRRSSSSINVGNTFSDILDISHNGFRSRMNSGDSSQRKYVNSIHETSDYTSSGTSYHLPAGYQHVYTNDFDTIILTNDSLFNPNVDFGGSKDWVKMKEH